MEATIAQRLYMGLFGVAAVVTLLVVAAPREIPQWLFVLTGLISSLALILLARRSIAAPIRELLGAAGEFANGNFAFRLERNQRDEFGVLFRSFNELGEQLQRSSDELLREVQQRRHAEDSAKASRDYLESALSNCESGIVIVNADSRIQFVNRIALTLLGCRSGDLTSALLQQRFNDRVPHPSDALDPEPKRTPVTRALCHGENVRDEEYIVHNQRGEELSVSVSASPVRNDSGDVIAATLVLNDVTEQRRLIEQLHVTAHRDPLTGLPNRTSILECIQDAIDAPDNSPFAILFMDFDRFKLINDSLGHESGDELLRQIATRIQDTVRSTDVVCISARLGGDEFVVLLKQLPNLEVVEIVAQRLLDALSKGFDLNGQTVCSTASIGIVTSEHRFTVATDMLRDADLAMYKSKAEGKGRFTVFDRSLRDQIQHRLSRESDMRAGIARREFSLAFQPVVSLDNGHTVAAEALARWTHPTLGCLQAAEFISLANETGLIVPIGDRFINEACRTLARWRSSGTTPQHFSVHVKVSRLQLLLPNLIGVVQEALEKNGLPPHSLLLAVTEEAIMSDAKRVVRRMNALRDIGIRIGVDGFGIGVSSLTCLHQFPIDSLRLDRAFVRKVSRRSESLAILNAVLNLADELNVKVIASGVENQEQLNLLKQLRCRYAQGYLFAEPMHGEQFVDIIGKCLDVPEPKRMLPADVGPGYLSTI